MLVPRKEVPVMTNRRLLIALGAALLVGGWGTTRFIHEMQAFSSVNAVPFYGVCVLGMTLGAGLIGFGVFPKKE